MIKSWIKQAIPAIFFRLYVSMCFVKNIEKGQEMATKSSSCPAPTGTLLIIGGKEGKDGDYQQNHNEPDSYDPKDILKTFFDLIDNKEAAIEIITTGSSVGDELFADYQKSFSELGFKKIHHIHHKERRDVLADDLSEKVKEAEGFFFAGGDQLTLTAMYGGTKFLTDLKERYIKDKIVIAGTSAGAMALSTPMIYAGRKEVEQLGGEVKITTGLEFLKDVCIDTHFVHRGRFIRMAQVLASNPTSIGIGIDEDTAMIIRNGTDTEVLGSGTITIIEGFDIDYTNIDEAGKKHPISIRNLKVHLLARGDKYKIPQMNPPHL